MNENHIIKIGQIWADKDKRREGRQLRIEGVKDDLVECAIRQGDEGGFSQKRVRINLNRFDRYKLIKDTEPPSYVSTDTPLGRARQLIRQKR